MAVSGEGRDGRGGEQEQQCDSGIVANLVREGLGDREREPRGQRCGGGDDMVDAAAVAVPDGLQLSQRGVVAELVEIAGRVWSGGLLPVFISYSFHNRVLFSTSDGGFSAALLFLFFL